jgi:23S rRNA pseudouridine1911/1915/1917 synthase
MSGEPFVVRDCGEYLILYKPPLMHCAPLKEGETGTLAAWCAERYPAFADVRGRKPLEGGLLHRLDYGTRGLVFAALSQEVMDAMTRQQEEGGFIKEYEAICGLADSPPTGFPPRPRFEGLYPAASGESYRIRSGFRPYGEGRKAVRPVPVQDVPAQSCADNNIRVYETEMFGIEVYEEDESLRRVSLRLSRGFRHQIRCHLAWLGLPILGDTLYGGPPSSSPLALEAVSLRFTDPLGHRLCRP